MEAGAIEMREGGGKAQALGSGRGNEAVEFRHPIVVQRIESTPERVIVEMARGNGRRDEAKGRLILTDLPPAIVADPSEN